jgi:hypothetical protein
MTTQVTASGITYAKNANTGAGPKINITHAKIDPSPTPPPSANDPSTDLPGSVYTSTSLQYAVVDANTVEFILTLDESVGSPPFAVGRIGLFTDSNVLFSITAIDAVDANGNPVPDYKFSTSGNVVGNRLTYSIYLSITKLSKLCNFTIPLLKLLAVPEVANESLLPDPLHVAFNTYQVDRHSFMRIPSISLRQTATQGRANPAWLMAAERLIPGQGEGVVPVDPTLFNSDVNVGTICALDPQYVRIKVSDPTNDPFIIGIRTGDGEVTNYGAYVDPVNTYGTFQLLYAGTGANVGKIVTAPNDWCIGYAIQPVSSQNATGWLCWIDFTGGLFARKLIPNGGGGTGATGVTGASGPGGVTSVVNPPGGYLELINGVLLFHPYNGNSVIINAQVQVIPSGGISLSPSGLIPYVVYYIYAYMTNSGMALEASPTGHTRSLITGVEIKNGDQSRTLVGFAQTTIGPAWIDQDGALCVLSWFNRKRKRSKSTLQLPPTQNRGVVQTSAGDYIEISPTLRNFFLVWDKQLVKFSTGGSSRNVSCGTGTSISFDGGTAELENTRANQGSGGVSLYFPLAIIGEKLALSEGAHYSTLVGCRLTPSGSEGGTDHGGGQCGWDTEVYSNTHGVGNPLPAPISITIIVDG